MKQITVRGVSADLGRRLARLSRERGESLNSTVLRLLERAVGIHERREDLERYMTWTAEDLAEFEEALGAQRTVDERLWR
jgi:hypothetical protein